MGLGKILKLGGIDNSPAKTDQSIGDFRVARNVMVTPENTIIPRYHHTTPVDQILTRGIHHIFNYNNSPISVVGEDIYSAGVLGSEYVKFYSGATGIPSWVSPMESYISQLEPQSFQSYRVNNTTYVLTPGAQGNLLKYDGVETGVAGCNVHRISVANTDLSGSRFLRYVTHTIDFDNNEPVSEWVEFQTGAASTTEVFVNSAVPAGYTQLPTALVGVNPTDVPAATYVSNGFEGTAVFTAATDSFDITTTAISPMGNEAIGSYLFVAAVDTEMNAMGLNGNLGLALKIKSLSPLKLDQKDAYLMDQTRTWNKIDLTDFQAGAIAPQIKYGTRTYVSFWEATSSTGIYYYRAMFPVIEGTLTAVAAPRARSITTTGVATATAGYDKTMFTISQSLNGIAGWYDVNTRKLSINSTFPFNGLGNKFYCMTKFQGMLLFAGRDYIWSSDTTLGGWIEQLNASNSYLIGDLEYGRITAICGTQDFLFVGRERKNYLVVGNLATGNYRVQEISETEIGPWCNNSAVNVKDTVMMINSSGMYQITGGGSCTKVSETCPKNFDNFSNNSVNEDVVFRLTGFCSVESNATNDSQVGLAVSFDTYRDLLVWMKRQPTNPCFVLNTRTAKFYEWDGMAADFTQLQANTIQFIQSKYYLGTVDFNSVSYTERAFYCVEDKTIPRSYVTFYPAKLYSTWLTNGEPSLEKEMLQLKLFGRIAASTTNPIKVKHFKDWDIVTPITNSTYFPTTASASVNSQVQYSHKKRLTSDKALAISVGIEMDGIDREFELESMEIEINSIQAGVKR